MLAHLTIHNYTLIRELDIEFANGMTVVTGETGAGKSIMLDALGLTLGSRADNAMIGQNANRAEIFATFDVTENTAARSWLKHRDLDTDTCILRRIINREGRSRAYINGAPSTLNDLGTLGNLLADIHSQHEHQSLLKMETHRRLLDEYGLLNETTARVLDGHQQHREVEAQLHQLRKQTGEGSSRLQLLNYQVGELGDLDLAEGETARLETEQTRLTNIEDIRSHCHEVIQTCSENDDANVSLILGRAVERLSAMGDENLQPVIALLDSSRIQVDEAISDLKNLVSHYNIDPVRLKEVEQRLSTIYDIARKHRTTPEELPALLDSIQEEIAALSNLDERVRMLELNLAELKNTWHEAAQALTKQRRKVAKALAVEVTQRLARLGMANAVLSVELHTRSDEKIHPNGNEDVEFLIRTNPDQPFRPLARIASGGELSRISLAIQVVTANTSRIPTLVFDEVDVGIGGAIAEVVGAEIRGLGDKAQIICVTHLPQVAAHGHHHFQVSKSMESENTSIGVTPLDEQSRIEEIARMLGGINVTSQSLAHAEEMYGTIQKTI